ncbi:radical SAM protein [Candidatus Fermentibacterales bacterium]|nr:radical SAM protein [Candidatus Fermentibacterales bacterium]
MRVLLLNPPSSPPVLRDFCCGETAKASYYWAPIDLLALSGRLSAGHEVFVLDATAERLGFERAISRAAGLRPDWVISLVAAVSLGSDLDFLEKLHGVTGCRTAVLGDSAFFHTERLLASSSFLEAAILDFTSPGVLRLLEGRRDLAEGVAFLERGLLRTVASRTGQSFDYPAPRHELFPSGSYSMPYSRHRRIATMLYGYGCPFRCSFCSSWKLGYRRRDRDSFLEEYRKIASLGFREFFLRDLTFGVDAGDAAALCEAMAAEGSGMVWSCEARADTVDRRLLGLMREAGCHLVMIGVESANPESLSLAGKNISPERTREVFQWAREAGISTLGHFIIGLPGETPDSARATIRLARDLGCDFASFNLLVPRLGSEVRSALVSSGSLAEEDLSDLDCSRDAPSACDLGPAELRRLQREAMMRFYCRPLHVLRLLSRVRSPEHALVLARNGISVVARLLGVR